MCLYTLFNSCSVLITAKLRIFIAAPLHFPLLWASALVTLGLGCEFMEVMFQLIVCLEKNLIH
jgi:hypothetical protein